MKMVIDYQIPTDLTDAQKKTTVCDFFVKDILNFTECFIRAELNHAPKDIKVTIEKPVASGDSLIGFADMFIEYKTPKEMKAFDINQNKILSFRQLINYNRIVEQGITKQLPKTNLTYSKKMSRDLHSVDYLAPYLLEFELEKMKETAETCNAEIMKLSENLPLSPPKYKDTDYIEQKLLISIEPTIESLKADINKAIRRIKTLEFYIKDVSQKAIVYLGCVDIDVRRYLEHENIKLFGLHEELYCIEKTIGKIKPRDDVPF